MCGPKIIVPDGMSLDRIGVDFDFNIMQERSQTLADVLSDAAGNVYQATCQQMQMVVYFSQLLGNVKLPKFHATRGGQGAPGAAIASKDSSCRRD